MGKKTTILLALFFIVIMVLYSSQVSTASCIKQERESLLRLKASFIDSSNRLASWKGTDCCSWEGVGCDRSNGGHVVKLDLRNDEYSYSSALVSNGVDSSLFELKYLNYLDLSANFFNYTQIPIYLTELHELRYLNLSCTDFHGTIPRSLGNLTKLVVLDFKNDYEILGDRSYLQRGELFNDGLGWVLSLSSLEYFDLSGIRAVESKLDLDLMQVLNTLPSLLSLKLSFCTGFQNTHHIYAPLNSSFVSKLQHLDLSYNMFDGPIPSFIQNMTSLRFLNLHGNKYNSSVPSWLSNLRNLDTLDLGANLFSSIKGGLSSMVRNNCHLKSLDLSFNFFHGENIFGSYQNLSARCKEYGLQSLLLTSFQFGMHTTIPSLFGEVKNLKSLYLDMNSFYGPIPSSFGNLSSLENLDISFNMLNGGIPNALFEKLSNLMLLDLRENNLDGVIPESFGQLRNLQSFDFSKNPLKGVLTESHFANLSRLEWVAMYGNHHLSFEIKHDWVPPFQLQYFSVGSSKGFGSTEFPRWLLTQKELSYLDLSNTSISGPIPTWPRSPNLNYLDISNTQISGPLPRSIGDQFPNMFELHASNMHINGSLPRSICKWRNLIFLGLSNNELSGTIPSCLSTTNLAIFDLSSNKFSGVFPNSLKNLSQLEVMHLANNKLEGEPLIAMRSWKFLFILDLEGNQFSGSIPSWMGTSLQNLQILNLRGNSFDGIIPSSLLLLPRLQILVLADNKLEGKIPPIGPNISATKCKRLMDHSGFFACNSADVPYSICYVSYITQVMKSINLNYSYSQLFSMANIDLSNNNLYGHIPSEIATMKCLFSLNLSHNHLSGTIPMEIGISVALESLDLSFNQLSGSIPNSMSSLNSLGVLKLSNNNFSGRIPREGHLSTFNDASSYEGNPYLCGDPLSLICPDDGSLGEPSIDEIENLHEEDKLEKMWFWIIVMVGYGLGFWGVVGPLILKRSWRRAYFQFMDETKDKIYVAILVNMRRLKQRMGRNN